MTNLVVLVVLASALLHAAWNALLHSGRDRLWTATVIMITIAVVSLGILAARGLPNRESWPYAFMAGVFELGYCYALVRAYQTGHLSVAYPIARGSSPLLVALGALLLAGESLTSQAAMGIALISGGILVLALRGRGADGATVVAGLATGLCIAGYSVVDGIGVRLAGDNYAYTAARYVVAGALLPWILILSRGFGAFRAPRLEFVKAGVGGLVALLAYGAIIWAMQTAPMGPISALRETSVLFAALLARILFAEPVGWQGFAACICIALGAILLNA